MVAETTHERPGLVPPQRGSEGDRAGKQGLYVAGNPRRLSNMNPVQFIYRFCLVCGANRFSNEEWAGVTPYATSTCTCDREPVCLAAIREYFRLYPDDMLCAPTTLDDDEVQRLRSTESYWQPDRQ